ncbi:hypothetical protein AALO_G00100770 [Alosa alosa]|uniref:Uncharacterized protein n=1 Tax=Alosa alosa TaxID=278164 RepID=A0AAV6GVW5_9TELE|nr:hypothetical protein AALO_G00100770 [Alosa alosa]
MSYQGWVDKTAPAVARLAGAPAPYAGDPGFNFCPVVFSGSHPHSLSPKCYCIRRGELLVEIDPELGVENCELMDGQLPKVLKGRVCTCRLFILQRLIMEQFPRLFAQGSAMNFYLAEDVYASIVCYPKLWQLFILLLI